ncbi:putative metallophosphoesterase YhaO [compost metagenome]
MNQLRFIHAADLHLDSPFKGMTGIPERLRDRLRDSTFRALYELLQLAISERVDFMVISGDVYDLADRSLRAQIRFQRTLEQLAQLDIPVYVIHGNHDPEDGRAAKLTWPSTVHFFSTEHVQTVAVEKPGRGVIAQIHGISYPTAAVTDNLALLFRRGELNVYQIGLLHTNVDGDAAHDNYAPCTKHDLLRAGMDYWALGHVHTRKVLNSEPFIVYPGNIQGRSIRETGPRGCYVVEVQKDGGTELTFHALDRVRWYSTIVSLTGLHTEQELRNKLDQEREFIRRDANGRDAIVRFALEGRGPLHGLLRKGNALAELVTELRDEETAWLLETPDWERKYGGSLDDKVNSSFTNPERISTVTSSAGGWANAEDGALIERRAESGGLVWVESIEDRSGSELDLEALMQGTSFVSDLLRLSQSLQRDDAALRAFAGEALAALQSLPQAAGTAALEPERLQQWLRAAEELAADLLAADGGCDG